MRLLTALSLLFLSLCALGQSDTYILNGSATAINCHCYTLTPNEFTKSGSVWNRGKINLNQPFDFWFTVNLGCKDGQGADGIVFMLQPISTSVGSSGQGMGFQGISPSIGIALDTWQNVDVADPSYDHISIQANGNINHSADLAGPVQISPNNINVEDCNWHKLRIAWNPATRWLRAWFDDSLRVEAQVDLVNTIFPGNAEVFWGFSAATGGAANLQQFCTALNPQFTKSFNGEGTCASEPVTFRNASVSFAPVARYFWDFGDGTSSTLENPPPHLYPGPGTYGVKMAITGFDGCTSDTLRQTITIGSPPQADFSVEDTCAPFASRIRQAAPLYGVNYRWRLNGQPLPDDPQPTLPALPPGRHRLELEVTSKYGCGAPATMTREFVVRPAPRVQMMMEDGCVGEPISFSAAAETGSEPVRQWAWSFGDGRSSMAQQGTHVFRDKNVYNVSLVATGENGCLSEPVGQPVSVNRATALAGRDTLILKETPFVLQATANGSVQWQPTTGLADPNAPITQGTTSEDRTYVLRVETVEGCTAEDSVFIEVFKGSAIWVPSAFTPNRDGRNDRLLPKYTGITRLRYFAVFNRWGAEVFRTTDLRGAWDGRIRGVEAPVGTYVWMVYAEDLAGKVFQLKGTITLLR